MAQVIKRDGSKESFDESKIVHVVEAAGLDSERAKLLAQNIATWVVQTNKEELTSLEIRDKLIEEMKSIDENSANAYIWYEQSKDVH